MIGVPFSVTLAATPAAPAPREANEMRVCHSDRTTGSRPRRT